MPSCRSLLACLLPACLLLGSVLPVAGPAEGSEASEGEVVFSFADERIDESSGLVDGGDVMFTVNDSGDDPVVYTVDKSTGETTAVTTYSVDDVSDVEGLAAGKGGVVWVGDIGDNRLDRASVDVYRVPVIGSGDSVVAAQRFNLVYPDSSHNAETLLAHPRTGRLYIVSKAIAFADVYAAPISLEEDSVNAMSGVARVPGQMTDGAFFPDGRHVLLRTYATASVYTFPDFRLVDTVDLPTQEQGEAVAIDGAGRIYLSSEGENTDVLRISLPAVVTNAMRGDAGASAGPPRTVEPTPPQAADPSADGSPDGSTGEGAAVWVAAAIAALTALGWVAFTASRPGSRRRR